MDTAQITQITSLVQWGVAGLFAIIGFFGIRTLKSIDNNQKVLFEQLNALSRDFYQLKGEHRATVERCGHGYEREVRV